MMKWLVALLAVGSLAAAGAPPKPRKSPAGAGSAIILAYHRFAPKSPGMTTVETSVFASQLQFLHDNGYHVVPLRQVVNYIQGRGELPPRAVVITADDGHKSVFTDMRPLIERYRFPVTLFIYPSAISNASYAMTWPELKQLQATGLFDVESHTYWHPDFRAEKRRRSASDYRKFVAWQLEKSREVLARRLGKRVDLLAWPYGIYDDDLMAAARQAGYIAAFSVAWGRITRQTDLMAVPRFIVTDRDVGKTFAALLAEGLRPIRAARLASRH